MSTPVASPEPRWQFADAEHALHWSADLLRNKRQPRLTRLWREVVSGSGEEEPAVAAEVARLTPADAPGQHLPDTPDDRYALALRVESMVSAIEGRHLLRLYAWGDWADEARLRGALIMQERARREGFRLRLNYRYSFRQLALQLETDHKTVGKYFRRALEEFSQKLEEAGLLFIPGRLLERDAARGISR